MNTLFKTISLTSLIVSLYSCGAPSFSIVKTGDKFADSDAPYGYIGKNNRLSTKSTQSGTHIDYKGVYLEPYVYHSNTTNKVLSIGFYVTHYNYGPSDGFRPINNIVFLTSSGERIETNVKTVDSDFSVGSWNSVSKEYNTSYTETGSIKMELKNFVKLANSKWVEVKINGGNRSQTYDKDEVSSSFLTNIKTFYKSSVQK